MFTSPIFPGLLRKLAMTNKRNIPLPPSKGELFQKVPPLKGVGGCSFCLLLMVMFSCKSVSLVIKKSVDAQTANFVVWAPEFRSDEEKNSYRVVLKTPKNSITGLFILKKKDDQWLGSLINEMSAKAFDIVVTDRKCEFISVISMLDKWYIKKTIAADLLFLIQADNPKAPFYKRLKRFEQNGNRIVNYKKKQIVVGEDGSVRLINGRRNLQYEFMKMVELDRDKMIL